jgi:hypothetical protein
MLLPARARTRGCARTRRKGDPTRARVTSVTSPEEKPMTEQTDLHTATNRVGSLLARLERLPLDRRPRDNTDRAYRAVLDRLALALNAPDSSDFEAGRPGWHAIKARLLSTAKRHPDLARGIQSALLEAIDILEQNLDQHTP